MSKGVCDMVNCGETARFMPVFVVPVAGRATPAGIAFGIVVCPACKIAMSKDDLLTDDGRAQIEAAVRAEMGTDVDWSAVELDWDPVPEPGHENRQSFEGAYLADDPEIRPVWNEAAALLAGFCGHEADFNKLATKLSILAVTVLCRGYRQFRQDAPEGGQLFLSSLMRSLSAQIEEQVGDILSVRVRVKNDPRAAAPLRQAEETARQIGESLADQMPKGWGFTLILSEFTEPGTNPGFATYMSNCKREDAIAMLRETAEKMDAR